MLHDPELDSFGQELGRTREDIIAARSAIACHCAGARAGWAASSCRSGDRSWHGQEPEHPDASVGSGMIAMTWQSRASGECKQWPITVRTSYEPADTMNKLETA